MTLADSPPLTDSLQPQPKPPRQLPIRLNGKHDLLHYGAYFVGVASLVFVAQTNEPKQVENALLAWQFLRPLSSRATGTKLA